MRAKSSDREERLAQALRANLKRRKEAAKKLPPADQRDPQANNPDADAEPPRNRR